MSERFDKLFRRRVFLHHYEQYMETSEFEAASESVKDIISKYQEVDAQADGAKRPLDSVVRYTPVGLSLAPKD